MTSPTLPSYAPAAPPDLARLPPPAQMQLLVAGKWISAAVSAAAKLGVADLLVNGP